METEDEMVRFVGIVVVRNLENVLAVVDFVDAVDKGRLFATAGGIGTVDGGKSAQDHDGLQNDGLNHFH